MNRPNIVWLVGDHFAYKHHIDLYPQLKLPTYHKLGAQGVAFDQAYTVCPLCQPARSSLLTGTYPHRHGVYINDEQSGGKFKFAREQKMISHYLQEAGYSLASFGKWHCGGDTTAHDYGFEGWSLPHYGSPYLTKEYADYLSKEKLPYPTVELNWSMHSRESLGRFTIGGPQMFGFGPWIAGGRFDGPIETHEAMFTAHMANQWLAKRGSRPDPFFMRVDVWGPHHPYHAPGQFLDQIDPSLIQPYPGFGEFRENMPRNFNECRRKWKRDHTADWDFWRTGLALCFAQVMLVDHALGTVVETLDSLGLGENTLVIYTADHGDLIAAHGGMMNKDSLMMEETMRVPLAMRWPSGFAGGTASQALVSNMDMVATTLDAAGALAPTLKLDSVSLLPLCENPAAPGREVLVCEDYGENAVEFFQRLVRWQQYKYIAHLGDVDLLFDLQADPYEQHNLALDPAHQPTLRHMKQLLVSEMDLTQDVAPDAQQLRIQIQK